MNKNNPYLSLDDTNDFGFSFTEEEEVVAKTHYANLPEQIEDLQNRLTAIKTIYLPFLENLNKEPEKAFIRWPDRKEVLDKQISKLKQLTSF